MTSREDHETSGVYTRRFRDTAITDVPRIADVERVQPSNRQALLEEASEADDFVNCFVAYFLQGIAFTILPHGDI